MEELRILLALGRVEMVGINIAAPKGSWSLAAASGKGSVLLSKADHCLPPAPEPEHHLTIAARETPDLGASPSSS